MASTWIFGLPVGAYRWVVASCPKPGKVTFASSACPGTKVIPLMLAASTRPRAVSESLITVKALPG